MNLIDVLGLFTGTCVTISVIPQIIKVWKTKKVKQISLKTFSILTFGIAVWIVYGILKKRFTYNYHQQCFLMPEFNYGLFYYLLREGIAFF